MRGLIAYWTIGCLMLGIGISGRAEQCPDEPITAAEALTFVAIWPVVITALFYDLGKPTCKAEPAR